MLGVELRIFRNPTYQPIVATESRRQRRVSPLGDIVVGNRGLFAQEPLDQITVVVEDKHNGTQTQRGTPKTWVMPISCSRSTTCWIAVLLMTLCSVLALSCSQAGGNFANIESTAVWIV
jgi:hypothetical protein